VYYSPLTRLHFERTECAGTLAGPPARRGSAGSPAQGTWVQFDVRTAPEGAREVVAAARFLAYGCPHVIAVADWIARAAIGREAKALLPLTVHQLREQFDIPIEKLGRLLIVEDAWIAAISAPC